MREAGTERGDDEPQPQERQDQHADPETDRGAATVLDELDSALAEQHEVHRERDANRDDQCDGAGGLVHRSRKESIPTVRPGREPIWRTPSRTPGANEFRSIESWRMVSVSP